MTHRATRWGWALLAAVALGGVAPAAAQDDFDGAGMDDLGLPDRFELAVVGVYRPVELQGRTVQTPREVFLAPLAGPGAALSKLIGHTLPVYRKVDVPMLVPTAPAPAPAPRVAPAPEPEPEAKAKKKKRKKKKRRPKRKKKTKKAAAQSTETAAAKKTAQTAGEPASERGGGASASAGARAAGRGSEPEPGAVGDAAGAQPAPPPPPPPVDVVRRPGPQPVGGVKMEVQVGALKVVEVRGEVVVAHVIGDVGVGGGMQHPMPEGTGAPEGSVDVPTVVAGDIARYQVPPPPPPPPPPLTPEEQARLDAERKRLERDDRRRRNPRGKYERPKMRWKL